MNIEQNKPKVLIVDDKPQNLYTLAQLLNQLPVEVVQTITGAEALKLTLKHDFCLAIVDVQMPEMDGYELVELLRGNRRTQNLPVIFVSAVFSDEYHHRKGYEAGAVDFMSKPFNPDILLSKVRVFLELYRQRRNLQKLNKELAEMNASKDKFFSIVAHDLRGPFNPLLGLARMVADMPDDTPMSTIRELGENIFRSTENVYNLLENLLQWSQLQRGQFEHNPDCLNLKSVVEVTAKLLTEVAAAKGIDLQSTVPERVYVYADENMLDTIIRNLTANAVKFTARGGQVTILAQPARERPNLAEVSVSDTGVGISPEDQVKLFKLGVTHTTKGTAEEKGGGLGLIICQEMVEKNGGRIWIESEVGQGTTVKFTVPLDTTLEQGWEEGQPVAAVVEVKEDDQEIPLEELIPPPAEELAILFDLAMKGNMPAIWSRMVELERVDNGKYEAFARKLDQLARNFEEDAVITLVEGYMQDQN
jgi:signal transduction histidine kinase